MSTLSQSTIGEAKTPKIVSASEAKNRLGSMLGWVLNQGEVIIKSRGEPKAVLMSIREYENMKELREQERRREAFARLEKLRERVRARNQDIQTEEEAMNIAEEITR